MAAPEGEQQHGRNVSRKRKKKGFLANARGFGKKGKFGHGSQLDQDQYDYFVRVLELVSKGFDDPQERDVFVLNALATTDGQEEHISSNQVGSRVIEKLIELLPLNVEGSAVLVRFMDALSSNLRIVVTNRFASHVLQCLLAKVTKYGLDRPEGGETDASEEAEPALKAESAFSWVLKVAKFTLNNLDEFLWDDYAIFVIRTVLLCLSGSPSTTGEPKATNQNQKKHEIFLPEFSKDDDEEKQEDKPLPDGFKDVVKEFYERILAFPQFIDLAYSNSTSCLLQTLLIALSKTHRKLKKAMIKHLIDNVFSAKNTDDDEKKESDQTVVVPKVFSSEPSLRLLEAALSQASSKYVTQMYAMCFMGRLTELGKDNTANFSVQRLLARFQDKVEFEFVFDEMAPELDKLIASGKSGVVLALCQACKRLSAKQGLFIENLMKALNCYEPEERRPFVAPLCARLCTYETFKAQADEPTQSTVAKDGYVKSRLNLHGTIILQTLLTFSKPIRIVNSILEMPADKLKALMCDARGSHVMDAFVKSEFVGEKSRERLLFKLQGSYVAMACSQHGSRALEALYAASSLKNQVKIMEELAKKEALVTGHQFGSILASKWHLNLFRHRQNEWMQSHNSKERTKELTKDLFADIIGGSSV